eukprot:g9202.t1
MFAASPLLLLVIGSLSSLTWGVVGVEAHVPGGAGNGRGGLGGGSSWWWDSSSQNEPPPQAGKEHQQQQQRRRLQTFTSDVIISESAVSASEGGAGATYTVYLAAEPDAQVNVDMSSASSEISISPTQLVFQTANYGDPQTVTVSAVDDDVAETLVEVAVTHAATAPDGSFTWTGAYIPDANLNVRVYDNDEAGVLLSTSTLYVDEGGSTSYTVKLMSRPSQAVTISPVSSEAYVTLTPTSTTINPAAWDGAVSFVVTPDNDALQVSVVIYDNDGGCYRTCAAGTWAALSNGSYECASCNPGYYCAGGCADPVACPAGKSRSAFGGVDIDDCADCSSGYYSLEAGSANCSPCDAGYSCSSATAAPVACPAGEYAGAAATGCTACADGFYNPLEAQEFCQLCPAGHECPNKDSVATPCSSGSYSSGGLTTCEVCEAGYYCSSTGGSPAACTNGSYSLDNMAYCVSCPPGAFCLNTDQEPTECPAGSASLGGTTACTPCEEGWYSDVGGATSCAQCPAGKSCAVRSAEPVPCTSGTFSALGVEDCSVCPTGTYSGEEASSCDSCPVGHSCIDPAASPVLCGEGYISGGGLSKASCPPGSYSQSGSSSCSTCPLGSFCPNPAQSPEPCASGFYADAVNMTECTGCTAGNYCPNAAMPEQPCPEGYYSEDEAVSCTPCSAGYACPTAAAGPIACSPGTFAVGLANNCTSCPPGYFCPNIAAAEIYECPDGTYSTGDASSCELCPAGSYCPLKTVAAALPCPDGYYSTGAGSNCTACEGGYRCTATGSELVPCDAGYYSVEGVMDCTPCPAGSACPYTDTDTVIPCTQGYYSTGQQQTCTPCRAGYYCTDPATDESYPCATGTYAVGGQFQCTDCAAGLTCSSEASTNCTSCPAGYFCDDPEAPPQPCEVGYYSGGGTAVCEACQPGYHCPEASTSATPAGSECPEGTYCNPARTLLECPEGTYGNTTAAGSLEEGCQACTEGYFCQDTGNTLSTRGICPAGYYCPAGSASATPCPAGSYNDQTGSWTPDVCAHSYPCPAGSYSGVQGLTVSTQCQDCPVGAYCLAGSTSPTNCPTGSYQTITRAIDDTACEPCEAGYACTQTGMFEMTTLCDPGHFCPSGTRSQTEHPCPPGTFTDSTNLTSEGDCRTSYPCSAGSFTNRTDLASDSECYPCPLGMYCGGSGSDTPDGPCSPGYYCPLRTAASTDNPCPAGTYSNSTSLYMEAQCEDCPPGYYCPEAATTIAPCPAGTYSPYNATQDEGPGEWPSCTTCPGGSYCVEASVMPIPCGVGMYSEPGQDSCSVCQAGFYCGSNETSYVDMLTGAGSWDLASSSAGMCFNGTFCAAGMTRAPDLARDACPTGHVCPAGAASPVSCQSGTYNPHTGMDDLEDDCLVSPEGYYTIEASTNMTGICAPGYYCPPGSTGPEQVPCPERYYRNRTGAGSQDDCAYCVSGGYCPSGSTEPIDCPRGYYCVHGVSEPEPCPLGTYGNTTGLRKITDCKSCDPGSYCDQRGLTNPAGPCDPGYYCLDGSYTSAPNAPGSPLSIEDTDIGGLCPAGGYCPIGSSYQQPCPSGTYNNFSGAADPADCSNCPPGFYCSGTSNPEPTGGCSPGHYCTGGANTSTQFMTQIGYYAPVGSPQQYPCPPGYYNQETRMESCLECDAGRYCPNQASTSMEICPVGYYCPAGSAVITPCPAGTFGDPNTQGLASEAQCTNCTGGKYCGGNALTAVSGNCAAGHYCTSRSIVENPSGQTYGDICPAGHYCEEGSAYPEPCPTGTYYGAESNEGDIWANDTVTGQLYQTYCTLCPAGKACNSTGLTTWDVLCEEGYFCKLGAKDPMPYCEAGEGLCDYGVCPAGFYCPTGISDPIVCPPGTYMNNTGAAECFNCPERHFCDGNSPREYEDCPIGHYCETGTDVPMSCPAGTYSDQLNRASASECTPCTAGYYCAAVGRTDVEGDCLQGYYCPSGSESSVGKIGAIANHACPMGQYCPTRSASPTDCPVGTYRNALNAEAIELVLGGDICPAATFCPNGTITPFPCDAGTYNDLPGQDACFTCPAGYYCLAGAANYTSTPCPPGYFCLDGTIASNQHPCPPGTYASEEGTPNEESCVDAPAGEYVSGVANTDVTGSCSAGYYCSGGASSATPSCVETVEGVCDTGGPCVAGQYCPEGSAMWRACPGGQYCADVSGLVTGNCTAGYYCIEGSKTPTPENVTDEDGNVLGDICTLGHYCPEGSVTPTACPSGTYSGSTGNTNLTACLPCTPGYICPNASTEEPTEPCPAGFFCPAGTIQATQQCAAGQRCLISSGQPEDCPAGTYQDQPGKDFCEQCPEGSYCEIGTAVPAACPRGSYCLPGTQWEDEHKCPEGTFGNATNLVSAANCSACTAGSFCAGTGLDGPSGPCSAGYYCGSGATTATPDSTSSTGYLGDTCVDRSNGTINDRCPPGHYCPLGSGAPEPCPPGTASSSFGLSSADECPDCTPGFYCPDFGTYNATLECTESFYCPGGDANATEVCPAGRHCPTGSINPRICVAGTYQNEPGQASCLPCPEGYFCPAETVEPVDCPRGSYCPAGTLRGDQFTCPLGTFGNTTNLVNVTECSTCTAGHYCSIAGQDSPEGPCAAGYYCNGGATTATPDSNSSTGYRGDTCVDRSNGTSNDLCPPGHFCPEGSGAPEPCPPGTSSSSFGVVSADDCPDCPAGFYCPNWGTSNATLECTEGFYCEGGDANATEACTAGHYCPTGSTIPRDCQAGTYQNETGRESCLICPEGYFCPAATETPLDCPRGSFCPPGTTRGDEFKCPLGTFANTTNLADATECSTCTAGWYCDDIGQASPTDRCATGYYCNGGATTATPDSSSSTGYRGDTCVDRSNGTSNDVCPPGHYCPLGSSAPEPCPPGTASSSFGLSSVDECPDCTPGFYCPDFGTYNATLKCRAGYYCPGGDANSTRACLAGHYCPTGSVSPVDCVAGTYQNDTAAADCDICPDRHYCEATATEALECPAGFYCPEGTEFCGSEGLTEPEGLCGAGYYCALGATSPVPANESDPSVGGLCAAGYACVEASNGADSPQPVDGITGYVCPPGTYCPAGSSFPVGCPPGTYNPSEAMEECEECLPGFICPGNTTFPEECPIYHFCPPGSATGTTCPVGTYGARTDLETASECSPCIAGHYCIDGNVTSTCRAGYFCKTGIDNPTPNRVSLLGVSADDCGSCDAGFVCFPGDPIPEQCPRGYYCPQGEDPIPCSIGTYNPLLEQDERDDCVACPAGSFCYLEGIGDFSQYPCPPGFFCLMRETDPEECPVGTYRNTTGAASADDCHVCPGGFQCEMGSVTPDSCQEATYCPSGSSNTTTCPAGSYCPVETANPIVCPVGYFCPLGSSEPIACVLGTYCPEGSAIYTSCPLGWQGIVNSNNTYESRDEACAECPPGTYGADPDRLVCDTCPGGYVCLGTTITATPTSIEEDGGFWCTKGHYCPEGSYEEIACAPGSYNSKNGSSAASDCIVCPADHYQDQEGSFSCLPCSSSSTSEANATACRCLGLNRAFQLSDGQCICKSGYEYYNEGGVLVSNVDGAIDCQPIVYERCYTGEALDADGICVSESDCDAQCGDAGGTFFEHIGLCECHGQQDLNAVCDISCRDNSALMFVDPQTGLIVIVDGNSTEYVDPAEIPSFAGALYCSDEDGCGLFPVTVSTNFTGVYGTGNAVAAAVAGGSTASSAPNRRHRRLTTTVPLRDEEGGDGFGTVPDDSVVRVRKDSILDSLTSEQDMIDMFLRRRASNYIPRNQYRDRFFMENGTHTTIPGAIPKALRSYTTPYSSKSQRQSPAYYSPEGEAHLQEQKQAEDDYDVDGENRFNYGHPPWMMDVQERDQPKNSASWRDLSRRKLVGTGTEPAVESPLSCVSEGDAVLFDISSGCYPVYEKDSLLNSNTEFDYGEFREIAALATSSAAYDTFAFVFEDAGTYVFTSSCNQASIIVVAVMGADVSCTTDAHFVPLTGANLIKLGVAKNANDITLTPDWALICGLLAGVAFMIFGVVSAVYYFRTKAWVTGEAAIPAYRAKAQAQHLEGVDEPARQRPGFFAKRQNQVSPSDVNSQKSGDLRRNLRSRFSVSTGTGGGFAGSRGEDIEMQGDGGDAFSAQDNPNVQELVDRMQKYHDDVEKEFTGQKDLVMKLHHLLQQEADELKRLLGAKGGVGGEQPAVVEKSTRATLARLKNDLVSRRLHEASVSTSEVEAISALKRLQELLKEGAEPFAKRVMMEIANPDIAGRGSSHDDNHASTPLLREIQEGAELIRAEVVDEMGPFLERERQREHAARIMLEGSVSKGGVVLPEDIVRTLKTMGEMDAKTNAGERGVVATMKRLADRLPACTQELCASEGLILRNLGRIRAMGNTSLETAEKHRGEHAIATVLDQLIQALAIVGARAETEKAAVDTARIDAEVERRHLEAAVDESIKTLDIAGAGDGGPPATSDDLQGMLKEIRTLVSSTGSASAANAAVVVPTRRASALFEKVAENEYRRHSVQHGDAADNSLLAEEAAEEEARRSEVEASLMAEQQVGVAAVTAVTESEKRGLEEALDHAGATAEEKQALMGALAEDQKAIEGILEGERIRMEESFRSAAAARKARDEQHAEEDAVEESQTKAELLHKQNAQIKELRRKHEAAQLTIVGSAEREDEQEMLAREDEEGGKGIEAEDDEKGGLVAALRKAHVEQTAMLESSLAAKAKSSRHALRERLAAQRAKREMELIERGTPASEAALKADKEMTEKEESQQQELTARLAVEKRQTLKTEAVTQREVRDQARAASKDPLIAQRTAENEVKRIREQAAEAVQALEDAMAEQGRARRKALKERLQAKRRAREAELEKRGAEERERCDQDADLTCLEELEAEALEEVLQSEREAGLKEVRACAAAAEAAATSASSRAAGDAELDPQAVVSSRKMKELHLAAMEKLERDLSRNEKNASRALKERLQEARAAREAALRDKESLSASEAAKRARSELEGAEETAQQALMEEMANDRIEAVGRANLEAEAAAAAAAASMREEANRLLEEHRDRNAQLQEEMKADAQRQKSSLQKRLAARRQAADAIIAAARPVSQQAAAKAAALADFAEEAERNALESSLLDEANRLQSEADKYERLVNSIVTSAEEAASAVGTASGGGKSQAGARAVAEEAGESLRAVHERAIAAMEMQYESKRRAAAGKLAQRKAAARAARAEALRTAGKTEEEIAKQLAEEDAKDAQEAALQDSRLQAEGVAEIEEERATQIAAVADGADPKKEAARIRERHIRDAAALEQELEQHCRDQRAALASRLRKRKAAREESLRRDGAGAEETAAAMQAVEFEAERSAIQLEEALKSLKGAAIAGEKQAAAVASGKDEHPESNLAELRARHQESENLLKDSLRAEAGARHARTRQRIAARAAERAKELKALGRSADEIKAEEEAIRAAGEAEQQKLEAVLATESEARIHAAREAALAAEAVLEARQGEARELRKNHEKAVAALKMEMAEKKRRGKEGVAARLEERKAKRAAELKKSKAKKEDVVAELARLEQDSKEEQKRVEAEIEEEAAMLAQAELNMLAKREAEARATQLTADNSRRAGELELERIRREHEEHQRALEESQATKRMLRQRALTERLDRRRQEKINAALAASESAEVQQKLVESLEQEKLEAVAQLEAELNAEACNELELHTQRQARAELAVRMSAQTAIEDAEKRAKKARDEHERSTKELDEQLAAAKISQGNKLRERLAKKRKDREEQLKRENANAEAIKEARKKMEAEEKREIARLDEHLAKERERLHAENLARAAARRTREEAEERDRAAAAADAADLAKQEAVNCLQRLQKQHSEQHAALEHQMEEEKRSREGKLRDRLAKKRKAKEAEMQDAALSQREKQAAQKQLEDEERAERQRFHDQLEEETKKSIEAQRRHQEETLAAAAAEAARMTELAAAASAKAAAADAVKEAVAAAEQDEFKRKAQKLKELSQANEEKERAALAGSSAATKSKLMERLAKKKTKAEAKRRELEAAQKMEEERLLARHKEEIEAARAAAAPGWTGDIAWDEAVTVAMSEEPRNGETQSEREARVLKSVLEADIVPENKLGKCVELVMSGRHEKETADLLKMQYKERASRLATSLGKLLVDKNKARTEVLQRLAHATEEEKAEATADVDDEFTGRQQQMETAIIQEMEPVHLEQQLELRQRQLQEIAGTFRSIAPESALKRLHEINATRQEEELQNLHSAMEREKEERLKRLQEEKAKFEEQLRQRHDAEIQRLQAEEDKLMGVEREAQEARLKEKQAELERQREEEKRKMEERSDQLNASQKEALLEKFKLDQAAELGALKAEEQSSKSKLEQKLAARRQKKMEELRKKEERQLKEKESRDAKRLQEIERQAKLEEEAEVGVLSASGSVSGLKVDIDQGAIQQAREAGGTNAAKQRLKETMAATVSRKMIQRRLSASGRGSISGDGGGASAAAAAAAATAATATAYTHISSKLEGIEALISALKAAQGDSRLSAPAGAASVVGSTQVYRDAEDAATIPEGNDLKVITNDELPVQALARLEFGEHLLSVLGLAGTVKLKVAKNLPPVATNANAFRNSYLWDMSTGVLHLHVRRLSSSGDFGLVLVHAAAHIQVDPSDTSNDLDPRFTQHFHRSLKVLTQELFKLREGSAPAAEASLGSPRTGAGGSTSSRGKATTVTGAPQADGVLPKSKTSGGAARSGEFAHDLIAERMEKYARASGHPRLVELLSRHANDQKDKFTLSDDEDQVSNVGDVEYMENFDNRDADSIFRSPIGSVNGDASVNEEKEEKKSYK